MIAQVRATRPPAGPAPTAAPSPRLLQFGNQHRHMLRPDLTDMLIADHALAIDHEGLGHPARAERHLHPALGVKARSEEHTSELQSLMPNSYSVFRLKNKITTD